MRPIEPVTREELLAHLKSLDAEARRWRFGYTVSDGAVEAYVNKIPKNDLLLGVRASLTDPTVVSTVHLSICDDTNTAELAISTLAEYRRQGFAELLVKYSIDVLRNRSINNLYTVCLPDNQPLLQLFRKLGVMVVVSDEGDKEVRLSIPRLGLDSIAREIYNYRITVIDKSLRPWASYWQATAELFKQKL